MASRDDITIRPFYNLAETDAQGVAGEERRMGALTRVGRPLSRFQEKLKHRARLYRLSRARTSFRTLRGISNFGVRTGGNFIKNSKGVLRFASNPYVLAAVIVVSYIAVKYRLESGKSIDTMGQELNRMLLGDMDDKSRASFASRGYISANPALAWIAGKYGVTDSLQRIQKDLYDVELKGQIGEQRIKLDKELQVQSTIDILVLRIAEYVKKESESGSFNYLIWVLKVLIWTVRASNPIGNIKAIGKLIDKIVEVF